MRLPHPPLFIPRNHRDPPYVDIPARANVHNAGTISLGCLSGLLSLTPLTSYLHVSHRTGMLLLVKGRHPMRTIRQGPPPHPKLLPSSLPPPSPSRRRRLMPSRERRRERTSRARCSSSSQVGTPAPTAPGHVAYFTASSSSLPTPSPQPHANQLQNRRQLRSLGCLRMLRPCAQPLLLAAPSCSTQMPTRAANWITR